MARRSAARTAADSSRIFSTLTARPLPSPLPARAPSATLAAVSPGWRPRRFLSSRMMISSNAVPASPPYSRWSWSRRSPGMPMTPIARPAAGREAGPRRAEDAGPRLRLDHHPVHEVRQLAHPVDVVAVVDDDPGPARPRRG